MLVGRDAELGVLTAAVSRAEGGAGGVVFLVGDAGAGKSRLAGEVCAVASSRGFLVLAGRAAESAVAVPFRPVAEALMRAARGGLAADAPQVAHYRPALGSLVPEWSRPGEGSAEISGVILGEALLRLLALPGRKGALLVLEDLQWADPETLAIVEYLADNLGGSHVLCVATIRGGEPSAGRDAVLSIGSRRAAATVDVPRLTERAVLEMAAACLGTAEWPQAVTRLLGECDGLPFAVEEVLAAAASPGGLAGETAGWQASGEVAVPVSIAWSVRNRLTSLGPGVGDVLAWAAVLGRQFDWTLLPRLADVPDAAVLTALRQAREVLLIEPVSPGGRIFRFRHSLTRRAILSGLLPPDLAARSARAAAAVEDANDGVPGAWCELAAELHEAAGQHARAAARMLDAGRRALSQGALSTAAALLRAARELVVKAPSAEPMLAVEIDEALVRTFALAGDNGQLTVTADRLIASLESAGADPRRRALVTIMTARTRNETAGPAVVTAELSAARRIAGRLHDTALACRADAAAARCAIDAGDLDRAGELAHRSLAAAESAGLSGWAAEIAVESLQVIGRRERVRDVSAARAAFEQAYRIASDEDRAIHRIDALHELGTIEMLEDGTAERLCEASELAHQAGAVSAAAVIDLKLGVLWSLGTDLDRAVAAARRGEQEASRIKARRVEALAIATQAFVSGIRADRQAAERTAARAERTLPGNPEILFTTWGLARVTASLFDDDVPGALRESTTAVAYAEQVPASAPRLAWAFYALLHAVCDEDGPGALEQARITSAAVGWNRGFFAYAQAVLEGRAGRCERATALASQGHALLLPFAPRWNHLARWLVAPAALHDDWGDPVRWLREAAADFDTSGHDRLVTACRGTLRRAGVRVPRPGRGQARVPEQLRRLGVTSRETDVFLHVAQGLSNAQIARRLHISTRTVEAHVASLAAKTGHAGRRELIAHAARLVPPQTSADAQSG